MNYYVFSYGGTGSTMLCNFLSRYGKSFHLHDKVPPLFLTNKIIEAPGKHTLAKVRLSQDRCNEINTTSCRVIYIYRDPMIAKISRPGWQHCYHIGGDYIRHQKFKKNKGDNLGINLLKQYVDLGQDLNKYEEHFDNWFNEAQMREYSILYINYDYLWENLNAIFDYCEIPTEDIVKFPKRRETEKNISEDVKIGLSSMYLSLKEKINKMPPLFVSQGKNYQLRGARK